ncbi:MAG: hypothetical protein ABI658_23600 [Acidimicrobiales bacterium]
MAIKFDVGDTVIIPWGIDEVRGTVAELYGNAPRIQVVVELTPELSSYVVDERTTVTLPVEHVRKAGVAA